MNALFKDVHCSIRIFLKSPGFTVPAVAALALGIGGTTAVFSMSPLRLSRRYNEQLSIKFCRALLLMLLRAFNRILALGRRLLRDYGVAPFEVLINQRAELIFKSIPFCPEFISVYEQPERSI